MASFRSLKKCLSFAFGSSLNNRFPSCRRIETMAVKSFVHIEEVPDKDFAVLYMNRPPVNGLNLEFTREITNSIKEIEAKKYRGFVLTSKIPTTFSAGLDIKEIYDPKSERFIDMWKAFQEMWKTLYLTPLVTIAAINGNAPAAGCMLALSCDYRIMLNSKSVIGINAVHLGIVTPKWITKLLVDCIGFRNTEKSLCMGLLYNPEQALAMNFVDELVDNSSKLLPSAFAKMEQYLHVNDFARRMTKISLRKPLVDELNSYENDEIREALQLFQGKEVKDILSTYLEKVKARTKL